MGVGATGPNAHLLPSSQGMKVSCTHFQCAAGAFTYLRDHFPHSYSVDMSHQILNLNINLMLVGTGVLPGRAGVAPQGAAAPPGQGCGRVGCLELGEMGPQRPTGVVVWGVWAAVGTAESLLLGLGGRGRL